MKPGGRSIWIWVLIVLGLFSLTLQAQAGEGTWERKKPMACARGYAQVAAVGGQLYVAGGLRNPSAAIPAISPRLEVYNIYSNTWVSKRRMPTAVYSGAAVDLNGKLHIAGGYTDAVALTKTDKLQIYDPITNKWTQGKEMPVAVASQAAAVLYNKMYVLAEDPANLGKKILYVYDPNTNTWASLASDSGFLSGASLQAIQAKLYAVGGFDGAAASNRVDVYDPFQGTEGTWTTMDFTGLTPMTSRYDLASGVINDRLYAAGGWDGATNTDKLEVFDLGSGWHDRAAVPTSAIPYLPARRGMGAAVLNGALYVVGGIGPVEGGGSDKHFRNLHVFTPFQVTVTILTPNWGQEVGADAANWAVILRLVFKAADVEPTVAAVTAATGVTPGINDTPGNGKNLSLPGLVVLLSTIDYTPAVSLNFANRFNIAAVNYITATEVEVMATWFVDETFRNTYLGSGGDAVLYAAWEDDNDASVSVADEGEDGVLDQELKKLWLASDVAKAGFKINSLVETLLRKKQKP